MGARRRKLTEIAQQIWEDVWQFRRDVQDTYLTPDRLWSARFATSESGEIMDAVIRAEPQFKRNNSKTVSREAELADTAFMLATTIGETISINLFDRAAQALTVMAYPSDLDIVPLLVGSALWAVKSGRANWQLEAAIALLVVVDLMDDPIASVQETLARLRAKWGGAPGATAPCSPSSPSAAAGRPEVKVVPPGMDGAREIVPAAIEQFAYWARMQAQYGRKKYGAPLTDKTEFPAWEYIWQEFADLGVYLTRLQLDSDRQAAELAALRQALEKTQAALVEAERKAETWEDRWCARFWRSVPGGLPEGGGTWENMREAQVFVYPDSRDLRKAMGDLTFVPLNYYAGNGYTPEDGEQGYHGQLNARIVYRPQ